MNEPDGDFAGDCSCSGVDFIGDAGGDICEQVADELPGIFSIADISSSSVAKCTSCM